MYILLVRSQSRAVALFEIFVHIDGGSYDMGEQLSGVC